MAAHGRQAGLILMIEATWHFGPLFLPTTMNLQILLCPFQGPWSLTSNLVDGKKLWRFFQVFSDVLRFQRFYSFHLIIHFQVHYVHEAEVWTQRFSHGGASHLQMGSKDW